MKHLIATIVFIMGFQTTAMAAPINARELLKQVTSDVMLRGALIQARTNGESCTPQVVSASEDNGGAITFEVQINCSVSGDQELGGGVVLMINIKGRAFSTFLDNLTIKVDKAG
jgi:hypothetical protein